MRRGIIGIIVALLLPVVLFVYSANAQTFRSGQTATVQAGETIDSSVWVAGSSVDIAGDVNGDVFCAGQNITVSGHVTGDVLCAGQTVMISGTVDGNVRAAGQTVAIDGTVQGSVSVAGQSTTLQAKAIVGRDASFGGQNVVVHGKVGRDLAAAGTNVTIDSAVGRDVNAWADDMVVASGADISGNVNYTSPQKAAIDGRSHITGKTTYTERKNKEEARPGYNFGAALLWALMLFVSAIIVVLLFPRVLHRATNAVAKVPTQALLAVAVGLVASVVMPVVIVLLMITILGVPFALVTLVAWLLVLGLSGAFAAYYLGRMVWRTTTNPIGYMAAGAAILALASMVPYFNALVYLVAGWLGSGLILLELRKHFAAPTYNAKKL